MQNYKFIIRLKNEFTTILCLSKTQPIGANVFYTVKMIFLFFARRIDHVMGKL